MSEFERTNCSSAWADAGETPFPEDFSEEEVAFASELRTLFTLDSEELPPLYVQTLLDDERHCLPTAGFEQRMNSQVFARLGLSRTLLPASSRSFPLRQPMLQRLKIKLLEARDYFNRPLAACAGLAAVLMIMIMVFASPAFAQGMRYIFGTTGVKQVQNVPSNTKPSPNQANSNFHRDLDFDPSMPVFWAGNSVKTGSATYVYQGVRLQAPTSWSKGPIVDVQYSLADASQGTGLLDIREFQVADADSAVLQVVKDGFATSVTLANGAPAVYVNGMWLQGWHDHITTYSWLSGTHCLLIMQIGTVVIWMSGDPRDGLTTQTMVSMANELASANQTMLMSNFQRIRLASESLSDSVNDYQLSEVYYVIPQGNSSASGLGQFISAAGVNSSNTVASTGS